MPKSVQMSESLSEEELQEFCVRLKSLPTAEEFKQKVEANLWKIVAGGLESNDSIKYESLPESSKQLIGTVHPERNKVPWWLSDFNWNATSAGAEEITLSGSQSLSVFEIFASEQTIIKKPSLNYHDSSARGYRNDIFGGLENFEEIRKELEEHLDVRGETDELALPDEIFIEQDQGIQTTTEFQDWFNSLIGLCPPFNEQLTALLMLNSKVKMDLAKEILPEEIVESIENLGLVNNRGEMYNSTYFEAMASAPYGSRSNERLLRYDWKVFDLEVSYINDEYKYLSPLEAALFESWVEDNKEVADRYTGYLMNQSITSESEYTRVALRAPVTRERERSKFVTLTQNKDRSLSSVSGSKTEEMRQILKKHGIEDD